MSRYPALDRAVQSGAIASGHGVPDHAERTLREHDDNVDDHVEALRRDRDAWKLRAESAADELQEVRQRLARISERLSGHDPVLGVRRRAV